MRLRDDDIKTLFSQVTPGTKVNIINTPIKVSAEPNGAMFGPSTSAAVRED
ncbi:hypothetical protein ACLB1S_12705 [Escherichia coli]